MFAAGEVAIPTRIGAILIGLVAVAGVLRVVRVDDTARDPIEPGSPAPAYADRIRRLLEMPAAE